MKPGAPVGQRRPYWGSPENSMRQIRAVGGLGVPVVCDHNDDQQNHALFNRIENDEGRLDILVNAVWSGYDRMRGEFPHEGTFDQDADFWRQPLSFWDQNFVGVRAGYACSALATPDHGAPAGRADRPHHVSQRLAIHEQCRLWGVPRRD